jgi:hypothetical protein
MEPWVVILLVVGGLIALWLIYYLAMLTIGGALFLLAYANEQGFIGLAVYIAAWVFMFPVMLVICIIIGLLLIFGVID